MAEHLYPIYYLNKYNEKKLIGDWFHNLFYLGSLYSQETRKNKIKKSLFTISLPKLEFTSTPILLGLVKKIMSIETENLELSIDEISNIESGSFVKVQDSTNTITIGKFKGIEKINLLGVNYSCLRIERENGTEQKIPLNQANNRVTLIDNKESLKVGKKVNQTLKSNESELHKYFLNSLEQAHLNKYFQSKFALVAEKNKIKEEVSQEFFFKMDDIFSTGYLNDILRIKEFQNLNTSYISSIFSNRNKSKLSFQKFEYVILEGCGAIKNHLDITNMSNVIAIISPQESNYLETIDVLNNYYQRHAKKYDNEFERLESLNINFPAQMCIHG